MRIFYDGLIYWTQAAGGVNRYFANIIGRLPSTDSAVLTTPTIRPVHFPSHPNLEVVQPRQFRFRWTNLVANPIQLRGMERSFGHDLLHPTYYVPQTWKSLGRSRVPVVVTVHDLTYNRFRREIDQWGLHDIIMRRAVRAADALICISQNTRNDLLEFYPDVPKDRVRIIPLAADLSSASIIGSPDTPRVPYFAYLGSRARYKNFGLMLDAFGVVAHRYPDVGLCVIGSALTKAEWQMVNDLHIPRERVIESGPADDSLVAALLQSSLALVYPSKYEGFGIPPLEAMGCGTVAITSNSSSIPEVVGDAALMFDPASCDELVDHMRAVIDNPSLRDTMIKRGAQRVSCFSWDDTARQTYDVYRSLVNR